MEKKGFGRGQIFERISSKSDAVSQNPGCGPSTLSSPTLLNSDLASSEAHEDLSEPFDPMKEDFDNPRINCYEEGPGNSLSLSHHVGGRRGQGGNVRLHVSNIPAKINKKALESLFSHFGCIVPGSIYVNRVSPGATTWANIEFASFSEAENAMKGLDRKSPYNLKVQFYRDRREQRPIEANDSEVSFYEPPKEPSAEPSGIRGVHPAELRPKFQDQREPEEYPLGSFARFDPPTSVEVNNKFMDEFFKATMGKKVVRGGRMFIQPEISNGAVRDVENVRKSSESVEDLPKIDCAYCRGPCLYICAVCRTYYCGKSCLKADEKKRKSNCFPRQKNCRLDGKADCIEGTKDELPIQNGDKRDSLGQAPSFNPFSLLRQSTSVDSGAERLVSSHHTKETNLSNGGVTRDAHLPNGRVPSSIDRMPADDCALLDRDSGEIVSRRTEKFEKNIHIRDPSEEKHETKTEGPVLENGIQPFSASELSSKLEEMTLRLERSVPHPPIPRNTFTKCIVVNFDENSCSVLPVEKADQVEELFYDLLEHFGFTRPQLNDPVVGALCAVKFSQDNNWYRAVIRSIDESGNANVELVDYGYYDSVPTNELKALPEEFASIPPMAIPTTLYKLRFPEMPQLLDICPIGVDEDGKWEMKIKNGPDCDVEGETYKTGEMDGLAISSSRYEEVVIVFREENQPGAYWYLTTCGLKTVIEMNAIFATIESHVPVTLQEDECYIYPIGDQWCRVVWTPPSAFLLDFGCRISVDPERLQPVPEKWKSIPALAGRLQLAEGTPSKYYGLKEMDSICVKAAGHLHLGVLALVQGESYGPNVLENCLKKENNVKKWEVDHVLRLLVENTNAVVIVKRELSSDNFCGALQLNNCVVSNYPCLESIDRALKKVDRIPIEEPAVNQDVIVSIDGDPRFYRGYVADVDDPLKVVLVDYGFVATPTQLFHLPPELAAIPRAAVRVVMDTPITSGTVLGSSITLKNVSGNAGFVTANFGEYGEARVFPWTPILEEIGIPAYDLPPKCSATLTAVHSPRAIYLRPKIGECQALFDQLLQDVGFYCVTAKPLECPPSCGELVCAKWSEDGNFYRAIVDRKHDDSYQVTFLDFGNRSGNVLLTDMRRLPDRLKKVPATAVKIGLKGVSQTIFNKAALEEMNFLLLSEKEVRVVHEGDLGQVSLFDETTGENLCESIARLLRPAHERMDPKVEQDFFMKSDVLYTNWPKTVTGVVVRVIAHDEFLFIASGGDLVNYINFVLTPQLTEYCESTHIKRYVPRPNELVLVKFDTEWFRAIAQPIKNNDSYIVTNIAKVFFIDYGNYGEVCLEDIRPIAEEFVAVNAAVKLCTLYGLPSADTLTPDIVNKIKELLQTVTSFDLLGEGENPDCENDDVRIPRCCCVWIPDLVEPLEQLGVPYKKPNPDDFVEE